MNPHPIAEEVRQKIFRFPRYFLDGGFCLRLFNVYVLDVMPLSTAQNQAIAAIPFAIEIRDARFQKAYATTTEGER